ncbi:hypothetical protein EKO04_010878 [Ascochyta lentis]|uniref:Heterokaryon incompatibility domain-containing protein n=1 Tax=Ascochyta lentis TaxID=205686 RepID=A0A8H7IVK7_9PLEO|nr:hypothetical protein EKO04_010878 [Ascochyta lentis]
MDRQASTYEYAALDDTKRQVRLLHLHPSVHVKPGVLPNTDEDHLNDIQCTFSLASLDDNPTFEALSYVWGDHNITAPITLHGHAFSVTSNLHAALKHLRHQDKERVLWVDALCINQTDNSERSHQVSHMRHIYSQATNVLIFLGEACEGSDVVIDLIKTLAVHPYLHLDPSIHPSVMSHGFNLSDFDLLRWIFEFFHLPWWGRLWTVQEYILAQETVFVCGEKQFDGAWLKPFEHCMLGHADCCNTDKQLSYEIPGGQSIAAGLQRASLLDDTGTPDSWGWSHLAGVLASFQSRASSNPLDKVYGLLGLGNDSLRASLSVDYRRLPRDVYTDVVVATINERKDLNMLSLVYGLRGPELDIPSFVPDYSITSPSTKDSLFLQRYLKTLECFEASKEAEADPFIAEKGEATIRAILIDTIQDLQPYKRTTWKQVTEQGRRFAEQIDTMQNPYESSFEAFWQTLCGGISYYRHILDLVEPVKSTYLPIYQKFQAWVDSGMPVLKEQDIVNFSLAFQMAIAGRLFGITEGGRIGFVPCETSPGDIVAIMPGGKVPYILRKLPSVSTEDGESDMTGRYQFLGDAYIHGVMHGEVWDASKLETIVLV